ncbi:glycosyltransferase family 39 protein [Acidicapsa ligni]|uniref:glycosyltransferase family 39 protein n=1 Tax=Acidicapsa ligni TaxID=542300 RepID=UPI0021DFF46D|nr:glycosyltransferase family 39 protein [Acidicapsa ligni]
MSSAERTTGQALRGIRRRELQLVFVSALAASLIALWWSWAHSAFLLYGDAEAHMHIARRLFDSHRPGITQLGSVWLPLPHLLMVPFVAVDSWWRSGFAPAIPSMACYLLASIALYTLARKWLSPVSSCVALVLFAANPNLLYLQTTAMTEPLFLCELICSVLLLVEWYTSLDDEALHARNQRLLWTLIAVLVAAIYTRYDGWILAFLAWIAMARCVANRGRLLRTSFILASVILLLAPVGWMLYNAVVFGDWLEFMRGPYSAKAIELRTASSAIAPHPGWHNPWVSAIFFVKAAEMDAIVESWGGVLFWAALAGTVVSWVLPGRYVEAANHPLKLSSRAVWWTIFLWLPLPFYAYSVSYGSVPIFLPVWWPHGWYNTRYGMELLPALALFAGFAVQGIIGLMRSRLTRWEPFVSRAFFVALFIALGVNIAQMLHEQPLTYVEAKKNTAARSYYNTVLPVALKSLHLLDPHGVVLMDTSTFASVVPHAGLTYRQTINESDKQFYWAALGAPAEHASIILAFAGDDIDKAVKAHPQHLRIYQTFHSPFRGWDQADATIYVTDTFPSTPVTQPSTTPASR